MKKINNYKKPPSEYAIITGCTSGIGYYTVKELINMGFNIIIACRNQKKAKNLIEEIQNERKDCSNIEYLHLDLSQLSSVCQFANIINKRNHAITLLVNNAGIGVTESNISTEDGFDKIFQVKGRVVHVSSAIHHFGSQDFEYYSIHGDGNFSSYSTSKLANILFGYTLQRKFSKVTSVVVHPGAVKTNIFANYYSSNIFSCLSNIFFLSPEQGCSTTIEAVTAEIKDKELKYYSPYGSFLCGCNCCLTDYYGRYVGAVTVSSSSLSYNVSLGKHLWELSLNLLSEWNDQHKMISPDILNHFKLI